MCRFEVQAFVKSMVSCLIDLTPGSLFIVLFQCRILFHYIKYICAHVLVVFHLLSKIHV